MELWGKKTLLRMLIPSVEVVALSQGGPPPRVCYATYGFPESLGEPRAPRPRDLVRSSRVIPANLHYSRPL